MDDNSKFLDIMFTIAAIRGQTIKKANADIATILSLIMLTPAVCDIPKIFRHAENSFQKKLAYLLD